MDFSWRLRMQFCFKTRNNIRDKKTDKTVRRSCFSAVSGTWRLTWNVTKKESISALTTHTDRRRFSQLNFHEFVFLIFISRSTSGEKTVCTSETQIFTPQMRESWTTSLNKALTDKKQQESIVWSCNWQVHWRVYGPFGLLPLLESIFTLLLFCSELNGRSSSMSSVFAFKLAIKQANKSRLIQIDSQPRHHRAHNKRDIVEQRMSRLKLVKFRLSLPISRSKHRLCNRNEWFFGLLFAVYGNLVTCEM